MVVSPQQGSQPHARDPAAVRGEEMSGAPGLRAPRAVDVLAIDRATGTGTGRIRTSIGL